MRDRYCNTLNSGHSGQTLQASRGELSDIAESNG